MLRPRKPKTAPGIIILHWVMALVLLFCVVSGLALATEYGVASALGRSTALASATHILPGRLMGWHMAASLVLAAIAVAYLWRVREAQGAGPRTARREVFGHGGGRSWRRANTLFAQCFFALVGLQVLVSAALLGGVSELAGLHLGVTLMLIVSVPTHVALQFALGRDHALKIVRPMQVVVEPIPLGRTRPVTQGGARLLSAPRMFGFALGLVFGAAAAAAFVSADRPVRFGQAGDQVRFAVQSVTGTLAGTVR